LVCIHEFGDHADWAVEDYGPSAPPNVRIEGIDAIEHITLIF
jgi:hypothetical protein